MTDWDFLTEIKKAVHTRPVTIGMFEEDGTELGTLKIGQIEKDGSMTLDLKIGPTTYAGAADSLDSLSNDIKALMETATSGS